MRKLWVHYSSFRYFMKHFCIYTSSHNLLGVVDFSSKELHCNYRLWIQEADEVPEILLCLMCYDEIVCYFRIPAWFHDTIIFLNRVFIFFFAYNPACVVCLMVLASEKMNSSGFVYLNTLSSISAVNCVFFRIIYECEILNCSHLHWIFHSKYCSGILSCSWAIFHFPTIPA